MASNRSDHAGTQVKRHVPVLDGISYVSKLIAQADRNWRESKHDPEQKRSLLNAGSILDSMNCSDHDGLLSAFCLVLRCEFLLTLTR
jgi:hypothetical protein